ncbi:hypothetical protein RRV45_01200 [Bacillus sp. DTU_2020_1000418_1_SI_GHA_SEK_038]|uniref:hypothetical protein n=1 Tax=Bacillus sp. DTU_2020_1000418_1_SI_GHA_SEK_038 TaxID=3077585 RepID=UPI0028ECB53A|nr:hypothetical protein [Bacillus sp. DTU_2020_1000418_1_SI_GHA_SEK_038]WNS75696.1 hypothetical protein RRV45_01200 [Bacillus sp. DTU_2020_1000418_1_SI_GHA_SEK_038]
MDWLRVVLGLISIILLMILFIQTFRFKKEFKEAINDDRSISNIFVNKWDKKLSKGLILGVVAVIFGVIAIFLSY